MDLTTTKLLGAAGGAGGSVDGFITKLTSTADYWDMLGMNVSADGIFLPGRENKPYGGQPSGGSVYIQKDVMLSNDGTSIVFHNDYRPTAGGGHSNSPAAGTNRLSNGDYLTVGYTDDYSISHPYAKGFVNRTSKTGTVLSRQFIAGNSLHSNHQRCVTVDAQDNYYVTGWHGASMGTTCGMLTKFNSSGTILWSRRLGEVLTSWPDQRWWQPTNHLTDSSGNSYVWGMRFENGGSSPRIQYGCLWKIDTNGSFVWCKQLIASANTLNAYPIQWSSSGNLVVPCRGTFPTNGDASARIELGTNGVVYNYTYYDHSAIPNVNLSFTGFLEDSVNGGYYWFGMATNPHPTRAELCFFKVNSNHQCQWGYRLSPDNSVFTQNYNQLAANDLQLYDDGLYFHSIGYQEPNFVVHIPTDGITPGTYGDYTFTDVSSLWNATYSPPTAPTTGADSQFTSSSLHTLSTPGQTAVAYQTDNTNLSATISSTTLT